MDMKNPPREFNPGAAGFSKMFHVETMRRIPHTMEQDARNAIAATTYEGRLFPQALSDAFGENPHVTRLFLTVRKKIHHFAPSDNDDDDLLLIHVFDDRDLADPRIFFVNMDDLRQHHVSGWHCFQAAATAKEIAHLYKMERG